MRTRWPPSRATVVVAVFVGIGVCGAALLLLKVLEAPDVPDSVLPVPDAAYVVGDVALPVDDGGGPGGEQSQRTVSMASDELDASALFDAVAQELEDAGWRLQQGPLGPGSLESVDDLDGRYELAAQLHTGSDGPPLGERSSWQPGQPYVAVSVSTVPG